MGSGCLFRGQIVKGFVYLAAEILFFLYFFLFGWHYLQDFNTLGTVEVGEKWNEELQIFEYTQGDNSMLILLFSVLTILLALSLIHISALSRICQGLAIHMTTPLWNPSAVP